MIIIRVFCGRRWLQALARVSVVVVMAGVLSSEVRLDDPLPCRGALGAPEFRPALNQVIAAFNPGWVTATLNRTFGPLLRRRRLEWIDSLLRFRHARLVFLQGAAT